MVIQTVINTGYKIERKIYRDILKHKEIAKYRTGFYAQRNTNKAGAMWELRGQRRILIAAFGNISEVVEL